MDTKQAGRPCRRYYKLSEQGRERAELLGFGVVGAAQPEDTHDLVGLRSRTDPIAT
jgi:DNA-binding PadR family transcriptional regulator